METRSQAILLEEMGEGVSSPAHLQRTSSTPVVHEDNTAAEHLANTGQGKKRARHLEVKYHTVQELVAEGKLRVVRRQTLDQHADMITKPGVAPETFARHRTAIGCVSVPDKLLQSLD